ncbi:MAG: pentapeptide repeat-containing protein [Phycisphaerae bacterium]
MIEYLLARHRGKCASVMERWKRAGAERLEGVPGFVAPVLEEFVRDEALADVDTGVRRYVRARLGSDEDYVAAGGECLKRILQNAWDTKKVMAVGHPYVVALLASEGLAREILKGDLRPLVRPLPFDVVEKTGEALRGHVEALEILEKGLAKIHMQPVIVGMLLAMNAQWRPRDEHKLKFLQGARLCGAQWEGVRLEEANLTGADLSGAVLKNAYLRAANLQRANCAGTVFAGAYLASVDAVGATFSSSDWTKAVADSALLDEADFTNACLAGAVLHDARLRGTVVEGATFEGARLAGARLFGMKPEGASFRNADLTGTSWLNVTMRAAAFEGAVFRRATIRYCDLEGMEMRGMDFVGVNFTGSYLTSSDLSGSDLGGAVLRYTGLAEVNWENVDLRGADFTKASFHLGSSRSGLVGSVIASEGTRTGFYTDDYCEQEYKAPEEIRKANLCGCDLREAFVTGTDFYLVDLRGARFSPEQRVHFANCGAILRTREA